MQLVLSSCLVALLSTTVMAQAKLVPRAWGLKATSTQPFSSTAAAKGTPTPVTNGSAAATPSVALNATVVNCFITVPPNPLTAEGLATPWLLQPPCSQAVNAQQSFVEAAVLDPATGNIGIYHPLVLDAGLAPAAPPVVPVLPPNAVVGVWLGFNGGVLQMQDNDGLNTNESPILKGLDCVNGLPVCHL